MLEEVEMHVRSNAFQETNAHDRAKLISKTLPEMHTKHCVLEKDSLNPLRFAKRCVVVSEISRERPSQWFSEASGVWQKNAGRVDSTSVPLLYTVGPVCRLSLTLGGPARATDAI